MDKVITDRITEWTSEPFDTETIKEINELKADNNEKELEDRFYKQLEFGTGGLRGVIGAGTNRMNVYTVGMATQGLANYIGTMGGQEKGVVIARDSRKYSDVFAREAAAILAGNGIKVYFFEDIAPTPFASFAVRHFQAVSGIVLTASHNPPEYNGYKVYWDDGGQIIPPHDEKIINEVKNVDSIEKIKKTSYDEAVKSGLIAMVDEEILKAYTENLEKAALRPIGSSGITIAYTPLHGTGYKIIPDLLKHFGFTRVVIEEKQSIPDSGFPTVEFPNPEERAALERVLDLARSEDADLVMATDPDADRMGVAFKGEDGEYVLINGNQIGTMLEYYMLTRKRENGTLPENAAVIKTIVTTELQREIAEKFGCRIYDVLTGFKWIASKMKEFDESGEAEFIFGGEESYGYLPVNFVRDKDAVSACYYFAEMADWLKGKGMSLQDFLDKIFCDHKMYLEDLHSLTLKGKDGLEQIQKIMDNFRKTPPGEFSGTEVESIADIKSLKRKDIRSGVEEPIEKLPPSNVIQFFLVDGSKITMRPSGTEPKIKFYFSVCDSITKENLKKGREDLVKKIADYRDDLLKKLEEI